MALTIRDATRKWGAEYAAMCGLQKYFPTMNAQSHVFWVDGTSTVGNDAAGNLGQTPDTPLLTITKALSLCTDGANDYVFILDYPSTAPAETWPIAIEKQRVHIIGLLNGPIPRFKIVAPYATADTGVFAFDINTTTETYGAYCEIANLIMGCGDASSIRGAIECHQGGLWGNHIHHCGFGLYGRSSTNSKYGIVLGRSSNTYALGEMLYGLIEHCTFGTLISEAGIVVPEDADSGPNSCLGTVIRNNHFHVNSGDHGIDVLHTAADFGEGGIYNNTFELDGDAADGEAVCFASGAKGSVHGNAAWTADGAIPSNNPFYDAGSTNMSWGANIRGGGVVTGPYLATPTNI